MALIAYNPLFWLALLGILALLGAAAWRKRLHWWPAFGLRLLLAVAMLLPVFMNSEGFRAPAYPNREIMLLDESASIPEGIQEQHRQKALAWLSGAPNRLLVPFAAASGAVSSPSAPWPELDKRTTSLAGALESANRLMAGSPGRVILVSDGLAAGVDVDQAVLALSQAGVTLDVIPVEKPAGMDDLAVNWFWAPDYLWAGSPFAVRVQVSMPRADTATFTLTVNGQAAQPVSRRLPAGVSVVSLPLVAGEPGMIALGVRASLEGDANRANNDAYTTSQVYPSPSVLVVSNDLKVTSPFTRDLKNAGVQINAVPPDILPTDFPTLSQYQVIFLDNLLATDLTREQIEAVKLFVSKLGKGLVFLGGRSAYTLGGYQHSPLEPVLPVKMEPPERQARSPVTFLLLIDASGSMGYNEIPGESPPIVLAKEAAMRVIETMRSDDTLGIASYSDDVVWSLPPGRVGDGLSLRLAIDSVSHLSSRYGTQMYKALTQAVEALGAGVPGDRRYILLLSDGKSADGTPAQFTELAQRAAANGITISTIALGREPDRDLLTLISRYGSGRLYIVPDAKQLPQVMVNETRAATGGNVQAGESGLKTGLRSHPVLAGLDLSTMPPLSGYNALKSRAEEGAEDILVSTAYGDPLLSSWQYGLGRVMAWMGDAGQEWTSSWVSSPTGDSAGWAESGRFWSQVVRYALSDPALEERRLDIHATDTGLSVTADLRDSAGLPRNLLQPVFDYAGADGARHPVALPQVGPGLYQIELPRPELGAYAGAVRYEDGNGGTVEAPASFAVNLSAEDKPGDPGAARAALISYASQTGGSELMSFPAPGSASTPALAAPIEEFPAWWLPALLGFWLVEIAIRRKKLPWR